MAKVAEFQPDMVKIGFCPDFVAYLPQLTRAPIGRRGSDKLVPPQSKPMFGEIPEAGLAGRKKIANRYYRGPVSDHFDGMLFFNPGGTPSRGGADLLRWKLRDRGTKWPPNHPSPFPPARPENRVDGNGLSLIMVGHSSLLLQVAGLNILTDPVWSERASPFSFVGPKRVNPPGIAFADLPPVDLVLVSHNHYDHLDLATLKRLHAMHDPLVVTPLGNDAVIHAAIPRMRVAAHDWGREIDFRGVTIHVVPAHHWSARGTRDRRMALWGGFVIETPAGHVYFAGDTGFHAGETYRALAEAHGGFRLAILPIGAYEPRWFMEPQHQDPDEAVEAMKLCRAAYAVGCHWGTFPLTNEPVEEPARRLAAALETANIPPGRFRALRPGEDWDVPAETAVSSG
jgi:L-ascorbate metabolism protein UlaG (beta-lactamase superfamily)